MPLSDVEIIDRCKRLDMITPFAEVQVNRAPTLSYHGGWIISWGTSSYGYDIRLGTRFKVFTNVWSSIVDPKYMRDDCFVNSEIKPHEAVIIPPNSFALAESHEYMKIPRDIMAVCVGKSTYARCGIIVNVTPLEPEWEGRITIEISNTTPLPAKVYAMEGIMQVMFHKADRVCETSYADKAGKYQHQSGITLPKVVEE